MNLGTKHRAIEGVGGSMLPVVEHLGDHRGKVALNCPLCGEAMAAGHAYLASHEHVSCVECGGKFRVDPGALLQWEMLHREVRNAG